ncbi:MAG: hypothetical protein NZ959_09850 [Armatimonadetes bacterium]|nr:hypothetical protein [Armatimonadota bacterium]MDW8122767.1 hypothetical protein [Armatimonadota bacterium]
MVALEEERERIYGEIIIPLYKRHLRDKGVHLPALKWRGRYTEAALVLC